MSNTAYYPTPAHSSIAPALHVIGIGMLLVGIVTAIYLYQSFAVTSLEKVIYGLFGFFFSLLSGVLPVASHHLGRAGHGSLAIVAWLIWFTVCFAIGTQTHLGFMANSQAHYEQETARNSLASQVAKSDLEQASKRIESLAIDESLVNESKAKIEQIEQGINAVVGSYSSYMSYSNGVCTPKTDSKGVQFKSRANEACAQIQPLLTDLNKHSGVVSQFNQYQTALTAKQQALTAMQSAGVISNTTEIVHPLFITQARLLSFNPSLMQSLFLAFSAVAYEILTAIVLLFASKLSSSYPQITSAGYQVNTQPYQLSNSGHQHDIDLFLPIDDDEKKSTLNDAPLHDASVHNAMRNALHNATGNCADNTPCTPNDNPLNTSLHDASVHNALRDASDKKTVGQVYQCLQCGSDYQARTVWQKYCPDCGTSKRAKFKSKAKG